MRILIVDDDPDVVAFVSAALQREGHAVDTAATGDDALWLAREAPFDAIVLDINIPSLDGVEVCTQLREQQNWTPILLLTGRAEVSDRVRGLDAGADDYLVKPFAVAELRARLRALVRRGAPARPALLCAGDVVIDPAAHRVQRCGQEVHLTAREYTLLEVLVRNADAVVTRDDIVAKLWDFAAEVGSNVVDVTVRRLREKIDRPFGAASIATVRGSGYIFRSHL
ncbi:MAG: response regulator transcription factor [Frankiaceae bacterium]|nr:response regulator transcription factor [Frankiaceae bacterium]MBV9872791.1 response regulator transcription factor [Frankiaceae bacterium]